MTTFVSTWLVREYSAVALDDGHLHLSLKFRDEIRDSTTGVVIAEANVINFGLTINGRGELTALHETVHA